MKRDFNKMIAEGERILRNHPRTDMSASEMEALLESADPENTIFLIHNAYCAGVAAGARISKADDRKKAGAV